jgi:hypothetical protein
LDERSRAPTNKAAAAGGYGVLGTTLTFGFLASKHAAREFRHKPTPQKTAKEETT